MLNFLLFHNTERGRNRRVSITGFYTLRDSKGKFLLSSYPSPILSQYTKANGWHTIEVEMNVAVSKKGKRKVEVLTSNYPIKLDS